MYATVYINKHKLTILLSRCFAQGRNKLPVANVWEWCLLLVHVFILQVLEESLQIHFSTSSYRVVYLYSFLLQESDSTYPMRVALVDWKNDFVELKNVLARHLFGPSLDISVFIRSLNVGIGVSLVEQFLLDNHLYSILSILPDS